MSYKSAILGCGPRAKYHILAYEGLEEVLLGAACDKDRGRLENYGSQYNIGNLYEDLARMLDVEKPDILHIVTPPAVREVPIELAAKAGVKGIIVEKPIALNLRQARRIKQIAVEAGIKIAVNTQRRYFKSCRRLKDILAKGTIGDVRFVRCVTKGNILSMGPHMVDLLLFFLDDAIPTHVWACARGMNGYDYGHPAPANMMIRFTFPGRVVAYCEDAEDAVGVVGEPDFWQHLELDFWGSSGRAWWIQNANWGYQSGDMARPHVESDSWDEGDIPAQREFTRALARWLDDDAEIHLNCLDNALKGFDAIMGALHSAFTERCLMLPADVPDDVVGRLEKKIG